MACGLCVEKYAILRLESKYGHDAYSVWCNPTYMFGFVLFILGNVMSAVALSLAAAAVLAPLSCINIVANVFFSAILLHERVTRNDILSTLIIMSGAGTVVYFSDHRDRRLTTNVITTLVMRPICIMYVSFVSSVVIGMFVYLKWLSVHQRGGDTKKRRGTMTEFRDLSAFPDEEDREKQTMTTPSNTRHTPLGLVVSFALLSAIFGAASFISSKVMSTMLANVGENVESFDACLPLLISSVVLVTIFATLQVHWMNTALSAHDCLTVVPVYYALAILLQSISGGVVFNEFSQFSIQQTAAYVLGVCVLIYGVFQLSTGHVNNSSGDIRKLGEKALTDMPGNELTTLIGAHSDRSGTAKARWRRVRLQTKTAAVAYDKLKAIRRLRAASSSRITLGGL